MEGGGDRLSLQGAGQILIKLSHPGRVFRSAGWQNHRSLSPACCVTPGKILITFMFCLETFGMGDYQATQPGAGFAGKSCPAPIGLGLIFVLWAHACSCWSPTHFFLAFSWDRNLERKTPWVFHGNVLSAGHEPGGDSWRPPVGTFPEVGAGKAV